MSSCVKSRKRLSHLRRDSREVLKKKRDGSAFFFVPGIFDSKKLESVFFSPLSIFFSFSLFVILSGGTPQTKEKVFFFFAVNALEQNRYTRGAKEKKGDQATTKKREKVSPAKPKRHRGISVKQQKTKQTVAYLFHHSKHRCRDCFFFPFPRVSVRGSEGSRDISEGKGDYTVLTC